MYSPVSSFSIPTPALTSIQERRADSMIEVRVTAATAREKVLSLARSPPGITESSSSLMKTATASIEAVLTTEIARVAGNIFHRETVNLSNSLMWGVSIEAFFLRLSGKEKSSTMPLHSLQMLSMLFLCI